MFFPAGSIARVRRPGGLLALMSLPSGAAERAMRETTNGGRITRGSLRWDQTATSLAEIAGVAQISKVSMKWASDRRRGVPPKFVQIAEIGSSLAINRLWDNPSLFETVKAENTEIHLEPGKTHKILRLNPRSIARRFARIDGNPILGGSTSAQTQMSPRSASENTKNTENTRTLLLASAASLRRACPAVASRVCDRPAVRGGQRKLRECGNSRELDKTGIGGHRDRQRANGGNCANSAAAGATSPKPSYTAPWSGRTRASCCRDGRTARTG